MSIRSSFANPDKNPGRPRGGPESSAAVTGTRDANGVHGPDETDHGGHAGHSGHGGHGLMMIACCIPMLAIAVLLVVTGVASPGLIVAALVCTALMVGMMFLGDR